MAPRIVIVTDRVQLDDQIWKTFGHCGLEPIRARSGRHLIELLRDGHVAVITTVVDKFEAAMNAGEVFDSADIVVLVDEGHRSHYGTLSARMQRTLPNACYVGLTGTPLMKRDKSTVTRFGGLIHTYTIRQAEKDKAVVPLFYEGRHVDQDVDQGAIDRWFERITEPLSVAQRADLKRKFTRASQLERAERRVASIALDIAAHFAANWQGTGFKGMVVTPKKDVALMYKKYLDETGLVSSQVVISAPDSREGEEDTGDERAGTVQRFWQGMMERFGDEDHYNKRIVEDFQHDGAPELLIVVDKLLVGFDAPLATVLYLARKLQDHSLLQAIARVNRVSPGKEAGFIVDYAGVLESLDKALDVYGNLPDFDRDDLVDTVHDVATFPELVRQRHATLLDHFNAVPAGRRTDRETLERYLADDAERHAFYETLGDFLSAMQLAMSSAHFHEIVPREQLRRYREDAKGYEMLRRAVKHRYQETVDYGAYEGRIQALLDRHVGASEPQVITPLVNVFDAESVKAEVARQTPGSSADAIAHALVREITERMDEDPVFYEKFGKLVKDAIEAYRAKRLEDASFLQQVLHLQQQVAQRADGDLPIGVREYDPERRALFRKFREVARSAWGADVADVDEVSAQAATAIRGIVDQYRTVNWAQNVDVRNRMKNEIEDYLYRTEQQRGLALSVEAIDDLLDRALTIAQHHEPR